ncbi:MAG: hypothetical protein AAGF07_05190 [Patescibacteria group bacterium]
MFISTLWVILYAISIVLHQLVFILFVGSLVRVFLIKYTPYASLYLAIITIIQVIFNGCPLTNLNNFLYVKAGFTDLQSNFFWGGIFGEFTSLARMLFLMMSVLMFYYSVQTWNKAEVNIRLSRIYGGKLT